MQLLTHVCVASSDKLQEVGKATTGVKKILSTWAKGVSLAYWESMDHDKLKEFDLYRTVPVSYYTAQVLLSQIHKALGFDRCYAFYVGTYSVLRCTALLSSYIR
jgi:hypothetical protein